jgi:hypothetical protein
VLPTPSVACGEVSSLKTLLDTDIASHCSLIDSSPTDRSHALVEGKSVVLRLIFGELMNVRLHGRMKPEAKFSTFWGGSPDLPRILRGAYWPTVQ